MTDERMRGFVRAFCGAWLSRDRERVAEWLADDVDWLVFGPVGLFPFFQRHGKAAVLAMLRAIDAGLEIGGCDPDSTLIDGPRAAALIKLTVVDKPTGRTLSLRLAMFAEVRSGKITRLRAVFDTFDAAEQALGREIDLSAVA